MDQKEIGGRIRRAREAARVSQAQVAKVLQIDRSALSRIESGERAVSALELSRLSRMLHRSVEYFLEPEPVPEEVLLRGSMVDEADRSVIADFLDVCRAYVGLESLLSIESAYDIPIHAPLPEGRAVDQGEHLADEERRRLGLGADPVKDMLDLVEGQGVRIYQSALSNSEIMGAFHFSEALGPCMLINTAVRESRRNFTVAHEYCHFLVDRSLESYLCPGLHKSGRPLHEMRANAFAAAFLMPANGLKEMVGRYRLDGPEDLVFMQQHYGVSKEALLFRLKNLELIDERRRADLISLRTDDLGEALGYRSSEEQAVGDGIESLGRHFVQLAIQAYKENLISVRKLAELLRVRLDEAQEIVGLVEAEV